MFYSVKLRPPSDHASTIIFISLAKCNFCSTYNVLSVFRQFVLISQVDHCASAIKSRFLNQLSKTPFKFTDQCMSLEGQIVFVIVLLVR